MTQQIKTQQKQKNKKLETNNPKIDSIIPEYSKNKEITDTMIKLINHIINYIQMLNNSNFPPENVKEVYTQILISLNENITLLNNANFFKTKHHFF